MAKTSFDALSRVLRALQTYQVGLLETVCAWLGDDFKLDPQAGFELKTGTIRNIMTYIPTKFEIEFFRLGADEHDQERFARRRQLALPELQKEARLGIGRLTPWEALVYCVWVADYGMRNAGDLDTAEDIYSEFQSDARRKADELSLPLTHVAFSLPTKDLEEQYFDRFDAMIDEIRRSFAASDRNGN